jgi:flagellar M-ring protein FliF
VRLLQRALAWFTALEPARRNRLLAALAVAVVAALGTSIWASRETYAPVLSGRGYDSALQAASAVEAAGIPYRIAAPDRLEVPEKRLGAARAAIAAEQTLPGLGDVSELQLGLTPQAQQWAFLRAAEGDLARMLNGIDGIVASQVHVVPRQDSLYIGEERPASASVFLRLEPGAQLQTSQVRAIVNLVANAVDGLDSQRVSVADDRGNLLATGAGQDEGALGEMRSLTEYRSQLEGRYERAVSQALLPVLGYGGGFSVTATLELDLTSRETTSRSVDADKQAVISEVNEETQTESGGQASGVPGVDANLPERAAASEGKGTASNRTALTTNYVYPTVDEVAKRAAGGVQRLSVAVQVDEGRLVQLVEASGGKVEITALKQQIDRAVQAAVGFDATRKDTVAVTYLPFVAPDWMMGTEPETTPTSLMQDALPYLVPFGALALLFWFVVRPVVGAVIRPISPPAPEPGEVAPTPELPLPDADRDLAQRLKALVDNYQPIDQADLNRLVIRESEFAADVLRKWTRAR